MLQRSFPLMVKHLLPAGLRGIVVAGLLSALMGSLAGVFNACSTLFTVDLYEKWRPKASQHQIVRTGRIATGVMVAIALAWIPVVKGANSLYEYLQGIQGYLAPPIFVVFFLGVFFKRLNAKGCLWAMIVGFVLGLFRMLVDTPVTLGIEKFPACRAIAVRTGHVLLDRAWHLLPVLQHPHHDRFGGRDGGREPDMTAPPPAAQIKSLTFGTATDGRQAEDAGELGLARGLGLGRRAGGDHRRLFVLSRVERIFSPSTAPSPSSQRRSEMWIARKWRSPHKEAGFSPRDFQRERRYANLGHLLPMFYIERAVKPGVSALPLR